MDHLKIIIRGEGKGKSFLSKRILVHLIKKRLQSGIFLMKPEFLVRERRRKRTCLRVGQHRAAEGLRVQWVLDMDCSVIPAVIMEMMLSESFISPCLIFLIGKLEMVVISYLFSWCLLLQSRLLTGKDFYLFYSQAFSCCDNQMR